MRLHNITKAKMPQINVAPTRTNLIRLKKDLRFAREGYEILDRKREALTGELVRVAKEADVVQGSMGLASNCLRCHGKSPARDG